MNLKKSILALAIASMLASPNISSAMQSVNGPLTFNEISVQSYLTWGSPVNILGSGFNHTTSISINKQGGGDFAIYRPLVINHEDTLITFIIPDYAPAGSYTIQMDTDDNNGRTVLQNNEPYYFDIHAPTIVVANSNNYNGTHPIGSFVTVNGTIYKISGAGKLGFPTWNVFLFHGGSAAKLVPGNSFDANLQDGVPYRFADGTLVRYQGNIYYMWHGMRRRFDSDNVFQGQGYSYANVVDDDLSSYKDGLSITSATAAHLDGTLINDNGTINKIDGGLLYGIPDQPTFYSYGYSFTKTVPMNNADRAFGKFLPIKIANGSIVRDYNKTIWLIEDGKKIGFSNYQIYQYLGYDPNNFVTANVDNYTPGEPL